MAIGSEIKESFKALLAPQTLKALALVFAPVVLSSLAALGVFFKLDADFATFFVHALNRKPKYYKDKVRFGFAVCPFPLYQRLYRREALCRSHHRHHDSS